MGGLLRWRTLTRSSAKSSDIIAICAESPEIARPGQGPPQSNWGRCQFQGDAATRLAHRPSGRSVCRHVRRQTGLQWPDLRLYPRDRIDARVAAATNATGNFVKIVQRLPVRIELQDYDPDKHPLFIGTSVVPYVYINKPPTGPDAGKFLQAYVARSPASSSAGSPAGSEK